MFGIWVRSHIVVYLEGELVLVEMAYGSTISVSQWTYAVNRAVTTHRRRLTEYEKTDRFLILRKILPNSTFQASVIWL